MLMRCIISSSVACLALIIFFPHYFKNGTIFGKQSLNIKSAFWFSLQICLKHFPLKEQRDEIWLKMYIGRHVTYRTAHSSQILTLNPLTWRIWLAPNNASKWPMGFNSMFKGLMKLEFSRQIFENVMKIRPVGAEMFHADGRTDNQTWRS
jgi:hypothetical protein